MSFIVAIDGPAGAGKSTVSRLVAARLGFALVDTGAIYRTLALQAERRAVVTSDGDALGVLAAELPLEFHWDGAVNRVLLAGEDVTDAIRRPEISRAASLVSVHPPVRSALLGLQRRLARAQPAGAVLEGRDIGTVVFPDAELKVFLTASPETRARRRFDELRARGVETTFESVLADQVARDREDETRAVAPLRPADDAWLLDSSGFTAQQLVDQIAARVAERQVG